MKTVTKKHNNAGFSLIELIIVIAIMAVMSSALVLGPGVSRRKEVDRFAKELSNQIQQMQTLTMAKAGKWRLAFYENEDSYYCVQEKKEINPETGTSTWTATSGQTKLGLAAAVSYRKNGVETPEAPTDTPHFIWRFNRDTGACIEGAGTYDIRGYNKVKQIKVYEGSGRCKD